VRLLVREERVHEELRARFENTHVDPNVRLRDVKVLERGQACRGRLVLRQRGVHVVKRLSQESYAGPRHLRGLSLCQHLWRPRLVEVVARIAVG